MGARAAANAKAAVEVNTTEPRVGAFALAAEKARARGFGHSEVFTGLPGSVAAQAAALAAARNSGSAMPSPMPPSLRKAAEAEEGPAVMVPSAPPTPVHSSSHGRRLLLPAVPFSPTGASSVSDV